MVFTWAGPGVESWISDFTDESGGGCGSRLRLEVRGLGEVTASVALADFPGPDGDGANALGSDAHDHVLAETFLAGAENDRVPVLSIPKMGAKDGAVLEVGREREGSALHRIAVELAEEIDELGPVSAQGGDVLAFADGLGLEGDLAEAAAFVPIEEQVAVEPADGGGGFEDSIQAGATEEGFVEVGGDRFAGLEFGLHGVAIIPELELIEGGSLGWRGIGGEVLGIDIAAHPSAIVFVESGNLEDEDAPVATSEGDAGAITGEKLGLEALGALGIAPTAHGGWCCESGEKKEEEKGSHGVVGGGMVAGSGPNV